MFYDLLAGVKTSKPLFVVKINDEMKVDVVILLEYSEKKPLLFSRGTMGF